MKLTIVTVTHNSESTLSDTLASLRSQTNRDWEYIIVDGLSVDRTVQVAMSYSGSLPNFRLVSEGDDGIYDAMNKGASIAEGEYLWFLNSDDYLFDDSVAVVVSATVESPDAIIGGVVRIDRTGNRIAENTPSREDVFSRLLFEMPVAHPSLIVKKEWFLKFGGFNWKRFRFLADYDMLTQLIMKGAKTKYLDRPISFMRQGGAADSLSIQRIFRRSVERYFLWRQYEVEAFSFVKAIFFIFKEITKQLVRKMRLRRR